MNRYQSSTPRAAFGVAALALTALTLALFVGAPATLGTGTAQDVTLASAARTTVAPTEVAITPSRIEVVGVREPVIASAPPVMVATKSRRGS